MSEFRFPQEFPSHLVSHAPIEPLVGTGPLGNHPLNFEAMHWKQFEQFCWWLLQRDYSIEGCQLIGGSGRSQHGFDLFAFDRDSPRKMIVFECKCWKSIGSAEVKAAIDRFLAGPWAIPHTKFVLIVAQQETAVFAGAWRDGRQALAARDIVAELWTGLKLTELIRMHPDVLVRFFPDATVSAYCNEWMYRVDFMTQLQKALVDERPKVRSLANTLMRKGRRNSGDTPAVEQLQVHENRWTFDGAWIFLHALLPNARFPTGSATVVVKMENTSGLTVALSQEWLLKNLLAYPGAPRANSHRPFISGEATPDPRSDVIIDIDSARLRIPEDGVEAMCHAFDMLMPVFDKALHALESEFGATGYPFVGQGHEAVVAFFTISAHLWKWILDFVREHDVDNGCSDWHIFDANSTYVKIYTTRPHPHFDPGYHAFIRTRVDIEGLCYGDDVVLTWDPPSAISDCEIGRRHWMSCEQVAEWFRSELIPEVHRWLVKREVHGFLPWVISAQRRIFAAEWSCNNDILDHRQVPLASVSRDQPGQLLLTIEALQGNMGFGIPPLHLTLDETNALYRAAIEVVKGGRGYVGYISSNLSLAGAFTSHEYVVRALEQRIREEKKSLQARQVRTLLSALLEGLDGDVAWLDPVSSVLIDKALAPLIHHHDLACLFERHSRSQ